MMSQQLIKTRTDVETPQTSPQLTESDLALWLKALKAQPHHDPQRILEWIEGPLKNFFPFRRIILIYGELTAGEIKIIHWLSSGHEDRYLQQLATSFELSQRGALQWWLNNQQSFCIDPKNPPAFATPFELEEIISFDLGRIAAHGIVNIKANVGTYFSFAGIPTALSNWHKDALHLIAPVLSDLFIAYIRTKRRPPVFALEKLTLRQREIVRQLANGFDDKTIARNLNVTEKTVRNQFAAIYAKVGVSKRTQLIALLR
ncbi:LuxR family transcriptional regulator [Collimonas pratensis]|uniref:response regulator transcription factor n=1 Tax=Collimonas pratensis TaxID=279113 RepID=UPI00143CC0AB|nr:helix-turn-helix transcriptional regulator [Collimonas pratensis]NKI70728.1 LuxR family transcriptional regulator [Collimonas pratensis]